MRIVVLSLAAAFAAPAPHAAPFAQPECIAPAKPGGGFDLTCKLAQSLFQETRLIDTPLRISYLPGGIGALAYQTIISARPADPNVIVAFSSGSLLNLAQGKFGKHTVDDVRWLATIGADYGVVAVHKDAPWNSLNELEAALRADASKIVFGAGGVVGSQDWMKAALVARAAGVGPKAMRFSAYDGGGEAFAALQARQVQVVAGDAGEVAQLLETGAPVRLLAVMAPQRLPGRLAAVPTAREQGHDIRWPIIRGFYVGPKVSDADYDALAKLFSRALATPEFKRLREQRGLYPFSATGLEAEAFVKSSAIGYRQLAGQFDLLQR